MTELHDLNMLDTEYAALVGKGYDPIIEHQLITLGQNPSDAHDLARLMGLIIKANPQTDAEWEEFNATWVDICNAHGCEPLTIDRLPLMAAWDDLDWV